jgi:uncharacterized protein with HEPN domain
VNERDELYLVHISECIDRIRSYIVEGRDNFFSDSKTNEAVLRSLQALSESTKRLSSEVKAPYSEIEWSKIAGLRNVLVHEYLGVDLELIWEVLDQDLTRSICCRQGETRDHHVAPCIGRMDLRERPQRTDDVD